jgi:hypothetical protein
VRSHPSPEKSEEWGNVNLWWKIVMEEDRGKTEAGPSAALKDASLGVTEKQGPRGRGNEEERSVLSHPSPEKSEGWGNVNL